MGRCFEFATEICSQCEHPMVAGTNSCTCAHCKTECTGRFSGCSDVWAARTSVLTMLREPMLDPSGAEVGTPLVGASNDAAAPASGSSSPPAPAPSGRRRGKKHKQRNQPTIAAVRAAEHVASEPEPWRIESGDALLADEPVGDAPVAITNAVSDVPSSDSPAIDPALEAMQERLVALEGLLAEAQDRIGSLEAGTSDHQEYQGRQDTMAEQADMRLTLAEARMGNSERVLGEQAEVLEARLASMELRLGRIDQLVATVADQAPQLQALAEAAEQRSAALDRLRERVEAGDERLSGLAELLRANDARLSEDASRVDALAKDMASHAEASKRRCAKIESRLAASSESLDRRVIDLSDSVVEHRQAVERQLASHHGGGVELQQRLGQVEGISRRTAADHENIAEAYAERLQALERRLEPAELGLARVNRMAKDLKAFLARVDPAQGGAAGSADPHRGDTRNLEVGRSPTRHEAG